MGVLANGLYDAKHFEDALPVQEAELSMYLRLGASSGAILAAKGNLANTYDMLRREQHALQIRRDVYSGRLKLDGKQGEHTLRLFRLGIA